MATCRMLQCCRCNGSRCCKNCSCVKAGRVCVDCLPRKRLGCLNPHATTSTQLFQTPPSGSEATTTVISRTTTALPHNQDRSHEEAPTSPRTSLLHTDLMPTTIDNGRTSDLPAFTPISNPDFRWGELNSTTFTNFLDTAYKETVHWKNLFEIHVPQENAGKSFTNELACLFMAFASGSALETIATAVLPHLVLQKPYRNSTSKDHIACLERSIKLWGEGNTRTAQRGNGYSSDSLAFTYVVVSNSWHVPLPTECFKEKRKPLYNC